MEKKFRQGNIQDLEAIKQLSLLAYLQFENILSEENILAWKENLSKNKTYEDLFARSYCVVCEEDNSIVGSAFLVPSGNPFKWFEKEWAYIRLVAVQPEKAGQGIGKMLTKYCLQKAKENDEAIIALHTSEFQDAARHIYEGLGFKKIRDLEPSFGKQIYLYTLNLKAI
jgi:GNAT superfamily N-acetyltransferase